MSLDYLVFSHVRPRIAAGAHAVGPIQMTGPRRRTHDDAWAVEMLPRAARAQPGDWVVSLSCRPAAGPFADLLATLIAENSGGGAMVCDHADAGEVVRGAPSIPDADLVPELTRLVAVQVELHERREAQQKQRAIAAWEAERQRDPRAAAEADDWSDV